MDSLTNAVLKSRADTLHWIRANKASNTDAILKSRAEYVALEAKLRPQFEQASKSLPSQYHPGPLCTLYHSSGVITPYPSPSQCDDDCEICSFHFTPIDKQLKEDVMAYGESVSDERARETLNQLVDSANTDRAWLQAKLRSHGDNLLNRWTRKYNEAK